MIQGCYVAAYVYTCVYVYVHIYICIYSFKRMCICGEVECAFDLHNLLRWEESSLAWERISI